MKNLIIICLFLKELKKQRRRNFLTIFAVVWGTLSIVLLLAFGEGLKREFITGTYGLGRSIVIFWGGKTSIPYKGLKDGRTIRFTEEDVKLLQSRIPDIELISPENFRWNVPFSFEGKTTFATLVGAYPIFEEMRTHFPERGGRFINPLDLKFKRKVVFLGNELKKKIFGNENAVGKTVFINNVPFKVIGILKEKVQIRIVNGPDSEKGTIPFSTYQDMFGEKYVDQIIYRPKDVSKAKKIEKEIYKIFGFKYGFASEDSNAVKFWNSIEDEKIIRRIVVGIQIFLGFVGGISMVVAGVGVSNIMYVLVRRRTKEIGIKLALGAKRRYIMSQFILEALTIIFTGGIIGIFISTIFVELLKMIPIKSGGLHFLGKPVVSFNVALITIFVLLIVGVVSGIFPARKASSLNPVDALRYE